MSGIGEERTPSIQHGRSFQLRTSDSAFWKEKWTDREREREREKQLNFLLSNYRGGPTNLGGELQDNRGGQARLEGGEGEGGERPREDTQASREHTLQLPAIPGVHWNHLHSEGVRG